MFTTPPCSLRTQKGCGLGPGAPGQGTRPHVIPRAMTKQHKVSASGKGQGSSHGPRAGHCVRGGRPLTGRPPVVGGRQEQRPSSPPVSQECLRRVCFSASAPTSLTCGYSHTQTGNAAALSSGAISTVSMCEPPAWGHRPGGQRFNSPRPRGVLLQSEQAASCLLCSETLRPLFPSHFSRTVKYPVNLGGYLIP